MLEKNKTVYRMSMHGIRHFYANLRQCVSFRRSSTLFDAESNSVNNENFTTKFGNAKFGEKKNSPNTQANTIH